jgi:beta-1,4-mannosyl-glycoprotein beta-1,4-N-acetylglucosaminyltransferase
MIETTLSKKVWSKIRVLFRACIYRLRSHTKKPLDPATVEKIRAYRKTIKIYDAFNFFNELEVLEIRLNILEPYVDFFVLVESRMTHSGLPKELVYEKNKERFAKFNHKIIHYVIEKPLQDFEDAKARLRDPATPALEKEILELCLTSDNIPRGGVPYLRDFYEKESVKKALVGLNDNDFCFISDLDEIWNPEALIDYRTDAIYKFRQKVYAYFLNNLSSEKWAGTFATKYKNIKKGCLNHLRTYHKTAYTYVPDGGWHFTSQGGAERVKTKIESYSYHEANTEETKARIAQRLQNYTDVIGRNFTFTIDESGLPTYLKENRANYAAFFRTH